MFYLSNFTALKISYTLNLSSYSLTLNLTTMAVLTKHILGTPSGTIGDSVCFTTWKGKACVRSLASSYNDRNSIAQQAQRAKFALIGQTLTPLSNIINIGWKAFEKTGRKACTALNAYIKYHLKNVDEADLFNGTSPDFTSLNADKLLLSRGALTGPTGITYANGRCTLTFATDYPTDYVAYAVLYNPTTQAAVSASAVTASETVNIDGINPGSDWEGDTYLFVFVTNAEGTKASNSTCNGTV